MKDIEPSVLSFLKVLFKSLNTPVLVFAIGIIVVVSLFGSSIPSTFSLLVYAISIGAMFGHLLTVLIPMVRTSTKSSALSTPPLASSDLKSGAILHVKVQGFSALTFREQEASIQSLKTELYNFFNFDREPSSLDHCLINFSGSDFVVFVQSAGQLHHPQYESLVECLAFGIYLQKAKRNMPLTLSIALHWGDDLRLTTIGILPFLYGSGADSAQRMASLADSSCFMVSSEAFEKLHTSLLPTGTSGRCQDLFRSLSQLLTKTDVNHVELEGMIDSLSLCDKYRFEPLTLYDQYKCGHSLYNFYIVDGDSHVLIGNEKAPIERVTIEFHEEPSASTGYDSRLIDLLIQSDEVALIGITHHRLAEILARAFQARTVFWQKIDVVFANEQTVRGLIERDQTHSQRLAQWESAKRDVQIFFESKDPDYLGRWRCLESEQNITLTGGRFVHGVYSSIRIAPVMPGSNLSEVPYIEIIKGLKAYDQFSQAIDVIMASGLSVGEWDLFGRVDTDELFRYHGIVNRARIADQAQGYCFPVVLIMLYTDTIDGLKSVIQERSVYNATSDIGTFSNISGRLATQDVESAQRAYFAFDIDSIVATNSFNKISGWSAGVLLPEPVWKNAAIREIKEELGIDVLAERLEERSVHYLPRGNTALYFKLFSLKLQRNVDIDEMDLIRKTRPYSNLRAYSLSELKTLHSRECLNRLLQRKFYELFVPIFDDIGIVKQE